MRYYLLLVALISLGIVGVACAGRPPKPPLWAVECAVGESWDRRTVATDRFEEAAEILWQSSLAASRGDPIASAELAGVDEHAGLIRWSLLTSRGDAGTCDLQAVARSPSAGDVLKAILAARIEARTGVPAQAIAPGLFGSQPPRKTPVPPPPSDRIRENAYGHGVHADEYGRPGRWVTEQGKPADGPVRQEVYGPGIGADPYGRPVRFELSE